MALPPAPMRGKFSQRPITGLKNILLREEGDAVPSQRPRHCSLLLSLHSQEKVEVEGRSCFNCYFSIAPRLLAITPFPFVSPSCFFYLLLMQNPSRSGCKQWPHTQLFSRGALCWRIRKRSHGNWCISESIHTAPQMHAQECLLHLTLGQSTRQRFPFHPTFPAVANRKETMKVSLQYCPLEINFTTAKCSFTQLSLKTYCLCYIFHPYEFKTWPVTIIPHFTSSRSNKILACCLFFFF